MTDDLPEWQRPWTDDDASSRVGAAVRAEGVASPFAPPSSDADAELPRPAAGPDAAAPRVEQDQVNGSAGRHRVVTQPLPATVAAPTTVPAAEAPADAGAPARPGLSMAAAETARATARPGTARRDAAHTDTAHTGTALPDATTPDAAPPEPRRRRGLGIALLGLGALLGSAVGTGVTYQLVTDDDASAVAQPVLDAPPVQAPQINVLGGDGVTEEGLPIVAAVAQAVTPSVVRIDILGTDENPEGLGSGVIYRSDGYIITNNHVVEPASSLTVRLANGDRLEAEIVGTDPLNDLAVLQVDRAGLPAIGVRDDSPLVGEQAVAIGSPFGLDASVTTGIISARNRDINVPDDGTGRLTIFDVLQTDAAINPGNSGGALVDTQGRLIGINTAILTDSGGSQGVGFAIPVQTAVRNADQLISDGFVTYPFLGVSGRDLTPALQEEFGLDNDRGALIDSVEDGSGAASGGVARGDIVVAVDGEPIASMGDLVVAIRRAEVGDTLAVTVLRDGEQLDLSITLGERPR